ncbi:hypothetical protein [Kaistia defluvii]
MLNAILSGKAGSASIGAEENVSWRHIFRTNEDLLTATIFERLSYLDGPTCWQILCSTFGPVLPEHPIAIMRKIEFWPRWSDSLNEGRSVEPDVLLQFELGDDPPRKVDLIVEAKLGGQQYADQWRRQIQSYKKRSIDDGGGREVDAAYFLAIGGLDAPARQVIARLSDPAPAALDEHIRVVAAAAEWSRLATAIQETKVGNQQTQRVLDDVAQALELFGHGHIQEISTLVNFEALRSPDSLRILRAPL